VRDKLNVFYYPTSAPSWNTIKKSVLLFDEFHLVDRPSFTFGKFGMIATASPLRPYEKALQDAGIQFHIHAPQDGPVRGEFLDQITSDVNDVEFLSRFQKGLTDSQVFCAQQIVKGNYGQVGDQDDVARALACLNLDIDLGQYAKPMDLFYDDSVQGLSYNTPAERTKSLVTAALTCSALINFALSISETRGIIPVADAAPYQSLLGAKYLRATQRLESTQSKTELTDLGFAIFDELVPVDRLAQLSMEQVIKYRKETTDAREAFLEHLAELNAKYRLKTKDDAGAAIRNIVTAEIIPEARKFKNRIDDAYEKLFGKVISGAVGCVGGGAALHIFCDLSWPNLMGLAGVAGVAVFKAAMDAYLQVRSAGRECAISYLLDLDQLQTPQRTT